MKRKLLSLILVLAICMLMHPDSARADIEPVICVGGTNVVDGGNTTYWLNDGSGGITADGASSSNYNVMFDGNNALTLQDVSITKSCDVGGNKLGIYSTSSLSITLLGSSTIHSEDTASDVPDLNSYAIGTADLTIRGNGRLTCVGGEATDMSCGIVCLGSILTEDNPSITAVGDSYGINILEMESINVNNALLVAKGGVQASNCDRILRSGMPLTPLCGAYDSKFSVWGPDTYKVINPSGIYGINLNEGDHSGKTLEADGYTWVYDSTTGRGTLTLKNLIINSMADGDVATGINVCMNIEGITIKLEGTNVINYKDIGVFSNQTPVTIMDGEEGGVGSLYLLNGQVEGNINAMYMGDASDFNFVSGEIYALADRHGILARGTSVSIGEEAVFHAFTKSTTEDSYGIEVEGGGSSILLIADGARVTAIAGSCGMNKKSIGMNANRIICGAGAYVDSKGRTAGRSYNIYIGNTQVTDRNQSNIVGPNISAGTVSYNPDTNRLTLDGATIIPQPEDTKAATIYTNTDIGLVLVGSNTVTAKAGAGYPCGIFCKGTLTISGVDGSLTSEGAVTNGYKCYSFGIQVNSLVMESGTVTAIGADQSSERNTGSYGILIGEGVTINGGSLTAIGNRLNEGTSGSFSCGIHSVIAQRPITINGGELIAQGYTKASTFRPTYDDRLVAYGDIEFDGSNAVEYIAGNHDTYKYFSLRVTALPDSYDVILPATQTGYTIRPLTGSASPVAVRGSYSFTVETSGGYHEGADFKVKANGSELSSIGGIYTISGIRSNQTITVEGVEVNPPDTFVVALPTGQAGYTVSLIGGSSAVVVSGGSILFNVAVMNGYHKGTDFKVKANGTELIAVDDVYTISNVTSAQSVTVEGVETDTPSTYTVTVPTGQTGYTVSLADGSSAVVVSGGSISFHVTVASGYHKGADFRVKANGTELTAVGDVYTIGNVTSAQNVTVEGVYVNYTPEPAPYTPPIQNEDRKVIKAAEFAIGETVKQEGTPETTLTDTEEELKEKVLTKEELARINNGEDAVVYLEVKDISETVSPGDKKLIEQELGKDTLGLYLDINLFKRIGEEEPQKVAKTYEKISVAVTIPSEMIITDDSTIRTYKVIRIHDGVVSVIEGSFDPKSGIFTFDTDLFSTYSLVYSDAEIGARWIQTYETMELGDRKVFSFDADGYDVSNIIWKTKKKNIAVVAKNKGKQEAVVTARSVGTDTLYLKYDNDTLIKLTITIKKNKVQEKDTSKSDSQTISAVPISHKDVTYEVKKGDTLKEIAIRFHIAVKELIKDNNIKNPDFLRIGQILKIKQGT